MNDMQVFTNNMFGQVRVVQREGEPWFVAGDVCDYFGVTNRNRVMQQIDPDDKGGTQIDTPGGRQTVTIISESGLYALLFALQPTKARGIDDDVINKRVEQIRKFKRWITHEVIPAIRKTGGYIVGENSMTDEELMAKALLMARNKIQQRDERIKALEHSNTALEAKVEEDRPKVAFADAVVASDKSILIGEFAKILRQNGFKIGQQRLFQRLRDEGYLCSSKGDRYNSPTQRSMELGLFEIKEHTVIAPDGRNILSKTTKISPKGQIYFTNKYLRK